MSVNACEQGFVALQLGHMESALHWFTICLENARLTSDLIALGCAYRGLGDFWHQTRDPDQARSNWGDALAAFRRAEDNKAVRDVQERLSML